MHKKKNILKKTKCYLIGSMENIDGRSWRTKIKHSLEGRNITFLDPYIKPFVKNIPEDETSRGEMLHWRETGQYDMLAQRMGAVRADDLRCIDLSDWLIAMVNPKIASWGSGEEIPTAIKEKKPLFLIVDDPKGIAACPLWFFGVLPHKYIYSSIEDAVETIKSIDDGKIKLSSDRWHLLKEEYR